MTGQVAHLLLRGIGDRVGVLLPALRRPARSRGRSRRSGSGPLEAARSPCARAPSTPSSRSPCRWPDADSSPAGVLGFAHTLGEFGVVLMVGGNIPGETRVVSIAIFEHVETLNYPAAHALSAVTPVFLLPGAGDRLRGQPAVPGPCGGLIAAPSIAPAVAPEPAPAAARASKRSSPSTGSDFRLEACRSRSASRGVTAVFGPSGCGKTTLLRALAGIEREAKRPDRLRRQGVAGRAGELRTRPVIGGRVSSSRTRACSPT